MLLCTTGMAQINEYGLKLGITNSRFEYQNKSKNLDIVGKYGQSIFVNAYAQVYKKEYTSVQIGLGYLERASTMPFRVPITIGSITDSITLNQNWAIESIVSNAEVKLKIPLDEKFKLIPYFIIGPQINYNYSKSSNIEPSIQQWKVNLNGGIGFDYDFNKMHTFIEIQKMIDFNKDISTSNNIVLNQQSMLIALGIKYIIKP
jgi:hypothetical protein